MRNNILNRFSSFSIGRELDKNLLLFYIILLAAYLIRVININYNSAFNDEAIYIVVGRMGLFANDWWSYGANFWMAGSPYIYPTLSALAYEIGGLVGSRFLNVIFGMILVEEIYRFVKLLNLYDKKTNNLAALISVFIVAFSGIGIFVSKLATYDMLSFLLFMVGINSFLKAQYYSNGKYYFITFLALFGAYLTKIVIAIYFPFLLLVSILIIRGRPLIHRKLAIKYLYFPFILAVLIYSMFFSDSLLTFVSTHKDQGITPDIMNIFRIIWNETKLLVILLIPSVIAFLATKKIKVLFVLTALFLAIPSFHLLMHRLATLDKHMYLTVIFMSIIIGYGVSVAFYRNNKITRIVTRVIIPIAAIVYLLTNFQVIRSHELAWNNTYQLQKYISNKVQPGEKILTEEGGVVVLSLYDNIFPPTNIITFDWIDYSGVQGDDGYKLAVNDAYFDYIELSSRYEDKGYLRDDLKERMKNNYSLVYKQENFEVYEKNTE